MNDHFVEDIGFVNRLASYLDQFESKGHNIWVFRCPICGDSHVSKHKKRGYLIVDKEGQLRFYCHNCGQTLTLKELLKKIDRFLYQEYVATLFKLHGSSKPKKIEEKIKVKDMSTYILESMLTPISKLPEDHIAYQYLKYRKVPESNFSRVFWTERFDEIGQDSFFGTKYHGKQLRTTGIVFKLYTQEKKLCGFQLRSIDVSIPKQYRFQTLMRENTDGFFGIEVLNPNSKAYVVEGCTDSLFLPNCVAVLNSRLNRLAIPKAIYVNDNEPRNPQVASQVEKCINAGYNVCMLPMKYEGQDINDLYNTVGCNQVALVELIQKYTYSGLRAKIEFSKWKR